jgi:uncharacterized protein (DUF1778 family)
MAVARTTNKTKVVTFRMTEEELDVIDRAAAVLGKKRTDFVLDASRHEAKAVLEDRTDIVVDGPTYEAFVAVLDAPLPNREALRSLLHANTPWE